jgi:diaminopimelate epimerase
MNLDVSLMSGAGNTFVMLDNRIHKLSIQEGCEIAPILCTDSEYLPRTEGLIFIENALPGSRLHFVMRFFNPDGSHGSMCGNGGRCAVKFAALHGVFDGLSHGALTNHESLRIRFSVLDTEYTAELIARTDTVRLFFPAPHEITYPLLLTLEDGAKITAAFVNVGSDHAVVWFPEVSGEIRSTFVDFDIAHWGARIRHNTAFPRGANANFYTVVGERTVRLRTFERGVEAETGACGTGAISTALIAHLRHDILPPVRILPPSGEELIVNFTTTSDGFDNISLEGNAVIIKTFSLSI